MDISTTQAMPAVSGNPPQSGMASKNVLAAFLGQVTLFSALVDCVYFLFFQAVGSPFLAWMNVVSVAVYAAAYRLVQLRRLHGAVMLIWIEAFTHAFIGALWLGWECGFHYLLLMFIPSVAMTSSRRALTGFVTGLLVYLVLLDTASRTWGPIAPISPNSLLVLKWLNITLFLVMFSALARYFRQRMEAAEARLKKMATVDALTGLYNRRHFESIAELQLARLRRSNQPSAVVVGDIDFFKRINDSHGHGGGDQVLVAVSRLLKAELREVDCVARWGGEEFVFLLADMDLAAAVAVTERVRLAVAECTVKHGDDDIRCTMSLGITLMLPKDTLNEALARADQALYRSKAEGRNRVSVA